MYTAVKHAAAIGLPALSALYYTLAQIWHFPNAEQVMASVAAVNVCLGLLMGYSTVTYNNSDAKYVGTLEVTDDGTKKTFSLNLNGDPNDIDQMPNANFKVSPVIVAPAVVPSPPQASPMQTVYPQNPPQLGKK